METDSKNLDTREGAAARKVLAAAMQAAPMDSDVVNNAPLPGYSYTDFKDLGVHGREYIC